jgi:hypothetical protein
LSPAALLALVLAIDNAAPPPAPARGPLPVVAAVVPGVLLHGSGHFVAGDRDTAWRLLAIEGIGFGTMMAGVGGLALTGASRRTVAPLILVNAAGAALFSTSLAADLYGVLAPAGGTGAALPFTPWVEARAGALYVRNPALPYRWLAGAGVDLRWGGWRLSPLVFAAADARTLRTEVRAAYRLFGPRPAAAGAPAPSGSFLDVVAGVVHHRERRDPTSLSTTTGELAVEGRLELAALAPSLAGSFFEAGAGVALGGVHYAGAADTTEFTDLLLARFGYGLHVGRGVAPRGEGVLFYDHRHDDFAAGLKVPGLGSGPIGHVGLAATAYLSPRWGLRGEALAGSAYVFGLSLLYRQGRLAP